MRWCFTSLCGRKRAQEKLTSSVTSSNSGELLCHFGWQFFFLSLSWNYEGKFYNRVSDQWKIAMQLRTPLAVLTLFDFNGLKKKRSYVCVFLFDFLLVGSSPRCIFHQWTSLTLSHLNLVFVNHPRRVEFCVRVLYQHSLCFRCSPWLLVSHPVPPRPIFVVPPFCPIFVVPFSVPPLLSMSMFVHGHLFVLCHVLHPCACLSNYNWIIIIFTDCAYCSLLLVSEIWIRCRVKRNNVNIHRLYILFAVIC